MRGELEANYEDNGQLQIVEEDMGRAAIPASIDATADAQGVSLPDSEFKATTFANGTVSYAEGEFLSLEDVLEEPEFPLP